MRCNPHFPLSYHRLEAGKVDRVASRKLALRQELQRDRARDLVDFTRSNDKSPLASRVLGVVRGVVEGLVRTERMSEDLVSKSPLISMGLNSLDAMSLKHRLCQAIAQDGLGLGSVWKARVEGVGLQSLMPPLDFQLFDTLTIKSLSEQLTSAIDTVAGPSSLCAGVLRDPDDNAAAPTAMLERDRRLPGSALVAGGIYHCIYGNLRALKELFKTQAQEMTTKQCSKGGRIYCWHPAFAVDKRVCVCVCVPYVLVICVYALKM